ncbi:MAG TPA: protoporphyrinogen oxidase [bacterium]|nr:protoporphyrinogen oxidase [bacterium]
MSVDAAPRPRIVVVGAGITGLAAALRVAQAAAPVDLVVCEAGPRPGGVIATERAGEGGEYLVEAGPDSFLTEKPEALRWCDRLGIADRLIGIRRDAGRIYVVHRGGLVPIPEGFRLVAPTRLVPWLRSPLFSWPGKLRMAMDCVLPRGPAAADESVAAFVIRRFGREVFDRVAQPMIGTIYTGDATALSLAATMPRLLEVERRYRSVTLGLARAQNPGRRLGIFATPRDGMQTLVDAATARLPASVLRLRTPVTALTRTRDDAYAVTLAGGEILDADAVILTVDARGAARLVGALDAALAAQLSAITYASSVSVTLAYRRAEIRHPLDGAGFVVPSVERRPILAASFSSVKFAGRAPSDRVLVRVFLGGALAPEMAGLDGARLVAIVRAGMEPLIGAAGAPHLVRVFRHGDAMPQYVVGHLERIAGIEGRLAHHPGLALAGAAYRGIGISDCIRSGEAAADRALEFIGPRRGGDRARREVRRQPG